MDGDFRAEITVTPEGNINGRVIDVMNEEEYTQLRVRSFDGPFVSMVRAAYEEFLNGIAVSCCTDTYFSSVQANRITEKIFSKYKVEPDFPWDKGTYEPAGVFRHTGNRKWFGLIMNVNKDVLVPGSDDPVDVMNLRSDILSKDDSFDTEGIYPAYHMNHRNWISVILDDSLTDERVMELVGESYSLTSGKPAKTDDEFIRKVLSIADSVPYGRVATYGQIAALAGRPKNSRQVGKIMSMADRYGDHPCHRIVNSSGRTVPGWKEQRHRLESEGIAFKENGCVDMLKYRWKNTGNSEE
ncbi:MAG: MGMT family protein [Eubacterium sp.]|nr:MGMT family protein [Eubacterium sp.]